MSINNRLSPNEDKSMKFHKVFTRIIIPLLILMCIPNISQSIKTIQIANLSVLQMILFIFVSNILIIFLALSELFLLKKKKIGFYILIITQIYILVLGGIIQSLPMLVFLMPSTFYYLKKKDLLQ